MSQAQASCGLHGNSERCRLHLLLSSPQTGQKLLMANMLITRPSNAFSHCCLLSSSAGKCLRLARLTRTGGLPRAKGVPPLTLLPGSGLTATTISLQKAICRLLPLLTSLNAIHMTGRHMTVHRMSARHMTAHHITVYHMTVRGADRETTQNG